MKVVEEDSATSFTNINDKINIQNDPIYKLVERQVEELEKIGKQMALDLKNSFELAQQNEIVKSALAQQKEIVKSAMDYNKLEKLCKKYEEEVASNLKLIDSLRARIEELEIDSITKDQDIKKLRQEFNDFVQIVQAQTEVTVPTKISITGTTSELSEIQPPTIQEGFIHEYVDGNLLKCKICENIFISNKEFNKHAKSEHKMKYLCFNCSEVFQSRALRGKHILEYHTIYCDYCNKGFSSRNASENLEKHVKEIHLISQDEYSDVIDKEDESQEVIYEENLYTTTTNDDGFFLHETLQGRSGKMTMKCKACEKTFNSHVRFRYHAKDIHHYEWLCLVCCQVFLSRGTRGKHMRKSHKQEFSCTLCSKKCYDKVGLNQHFRAKHPGQKFTPIQTPPTLASTSTFTSNQPPSTLASTSTSTSNQTPSTSQPDVLFIHEIILPEEIQTNEKTHYQLKCKICNDISDTHANFNLHAKTSHDYKQLCNFCSQVFSQKSLKKRHTDQFHFYNCQVCNRKFRIESSLKDHCRAKKHKMISEPTQSSLLEFSQSRGVRIITKRPNYLEYERSDNVEDEVEEYSDYNEDGVDESEEYSDSNTEEDESEEYSDSNVEEDESEEYSDENEEVDESEVGSNSCDDHDTKEKYRTRKA